MIDPDKPFGLFANYTYYPHGGMWDYRGDFASVDEAVAFAKSPRSEDWEGSGTGFRLLTLEPWR